MSKRTKILVDPKVQWSIAGRVLLHWVLLMLCLISIGALVRLMASANSASFSDALWAALKSQAAVAGIMLILLPVFIRDTMKLSNRFAGPMYRLRTVLSDMASGEEGRAIQFRVGDFWHQAADDFNVVVTEYNRLKERNAELESELAELREGELAQ